MFIIEDGTGIANANGYVSVAFVDTYALDRGFTAWTGADAVKEAAIVRATDHIDRVYGARFKGIKSTDAQGLQWPRTDAWTKDDYQLLRVPAALQNATAEYAIRALLYGVLTPDAPPLNPRQTLTTGATLPKVGVGSGALTMTRTKVGPIETEKRYDNTARGQLDSFPAADMMLAPLLTGYNRRLVRG